MGGLAAVVLDDEELPEVVEALSPLPQPESTTATATPVVSTLHAPITRS